VQDLPLPASLKPTGPVLLVRSPDGRGVYVVAWDAAGDTPGAQSVLSYGCVFLCFTMFYVYPVIDTNRHTLIPYPKPQTPQTMQRQLQDGRAEAAPDAFELLRPRLQHRLRGI
jgi:hypothetical protein